MSSMLGGGGLPDVGNVPVIGDVADFPVVGDATNGVRGNDEAGSGAQDTVEQVGGMVGDAAEGVIDALGGGS
jgi:hypothetical protein